MFVPRHNNAARRRTARAIRNREAKRRAKFKLELSTVIKLLVAALLLTALYATSPLILFPECQGTSIPRYCVD